MSMHFSYFSIFCFVSLFTIAFIHADDTGFKREKTHFNKDPLDYTERDVDSLYDEWEVINSEKEKKNTILFD